MNNNEILKKFKMNVAITNFKEENTKEHTQQEQINWRIYVMKKKIIAGLCAGLTIMSGVVFATNFDKVIGDFGLGKGIKNAVESGYVAETDMNYINSNTILTDKQEAILLNNIDVGSKIENFMMDDLNISTHILFSIGTKINEKIDLEKLDNILLTDLIITDEENRILFCANKERFNKYCEENKLNYKYGEFNENNYNCGINSFIEYHNKYDGIVKITYNLYIGNEQNFPKSKKLNFKFSNIELKSIENDIVNINGDWNINVDVPEIMYNRTKEYYRVISCDDKDFDIYTTTVSDTGFEIGLIINNIEKPRELTNEERNQINSLYEYSKNEETNTFIAQENHNISKEEAEQIKERYYTWLQLREPISCSSQNIKGENTQASYIENENGEKFYCSFSPSRKATTNFIDGNRYDFYETFEMTKYNATDKLKIKLYYYGKPVTIEVEKIK